MLVPCARCGLRKHFGAEPEAPYLCDACRDLPVVASATPPAPETAPPAAAHPVPGTSRPPFRPTALIVFGTITGAGALATLGLPDAWRVLGVLSIVEVLSCIAAGTLLLHATLRWYAHRSVDVTPLFCLLAVLVYGTMAATVCAAAFAISTVEYLPLLLAAVLILFSLGVARKVKAPLLEALGLASLASFAWTAVTVVLLAPIVVMFGAGPLRSYLRW